MKRKIITALSSVLVLVFLFSGCLPSSNNKKETKYASQFSDIETGQTTMAATSTETAATQAGPPDVVAYYYLNKTVTKDGMSAGFEVSLPKIESVKPGAVAINAQINELKVDVEQAYAAAGNLQDFNEIVKMSYQTAQKDSIIFISVYTTTGYLASEGFAENYHYAYNYITDQSVPKGALASMFNLTESQIISLVNNYLTDRGGMAVTGYDKIQLFVDEFGHLTADAMSESVMGPEYPEIIVLT